MRIWQYNSTKGGIENALQLNDKAADPTAKDPKTQHIVKIFTACLNPVDYKPSEALPSFVISKPATPGIDFVGRILTPATNSDLKAGQMVFGVAGTSPLAAGALAEKAVVPVVGAVPLPAGLAPHNAATIGVAGITAYQSLIPFVKNGDRVFINGGSGGCGIFGIQIAKIKGCHVTTACSTANVELCKSVGADEVIDYKKGSVLEALKQKQSFDHVVDNVGYDQSLYWKAHEYMKDSAKFVGIAGEPSLRHLKYSAAVKFLPGFLGGGKREHVSFLAKPDAETLKQLGQWMAEGKIKAVIDATYPFEEAPDAFRKLKTGRAKGKIAIYVASIDEHK